jgi:hypothetical protein
MCGGGRVVGLVARRSQEGAARGGVGRQARLAEGGRRKEKKERKGRKEKEKRKREREKEGRKNEK